MTPFTAVGEIKVAVWAALVGPGDQSSPDVLYIVVERNITLVKDVLVLRSYRPVIGDGIDQLGRVGLLRVYSLAQLSIEVAEERLCVFVVTEMDIIVVSGDQILEGERGLDSSL